MRYQVHGLEKTVYCLRLIVSRRSMRPGFTLLEFLIVIGLLSITIGSILLFLTSVLKGTNQANITAEVKQNGQVVLDTLESQIRNGTDAVCINPTNGSFCASPTQPTSHIKILRTNSDPLHIRCISSSGTTQNGRIEIAVSAVDLGTIPANFTSITSQDTVSGVSISGVSVPDCNTIFTIVPSSGGVSDPPIVTLSFTVNQGVAAASRSDFLASVDFQTTISLRGY